MNDENAIRILSRRTTIPDDDVSYDEICDAIDMAIIALRAQQTPAKPDRSRWDGCDLCISWDTGKPIDDMRGDIITHHGACTSCYGFGEIYDYRDKKVLGYFKFCPFCGRPLTEDAWAELERRINGGTVD